MQDQILAKLTETLDLVKEKVIRIEERLTGVEQLKADVNSLKVSNSKLDESTKSAHTRLNELERKVGQVLFWASTTVIGALIIGLISFAIFKK